MKRSSLISLSLILLLNSFWSISFGYNFTTQATTNDSQAKATVASHNLQSPALASSNPYSVTTQHNDPQRSGLDNQETILNTSNVTPSTFGKLFSRPVDGQIYNQPLYMPNVTITDGTTHNLVIVGTMHNTLYAFDADDPTNDTPLWSIAWGNSVQVPNGNVGNNCGNGTNYPNSTYRDIYPEIGIIGTPVIDPATNLLYVVTMQKDPNKPASDITAYSHTLHVVNITSGQEVQTPLVIAASVAGNGDGSNNGSLTFDDETQNQRPALLLLNGVVYVGFAGFCDNYPYHGWLFGYKASDISKTPSIYVTSRNAGYSGIWQGGQGPAADPNGKSIYFETGNGDFDTQVITPTNFGDSIIKLKAFDASNPTTDTTPIDWFTPWNQKTYNQGDQDLGSGGVMFMPGTNYLIGSSKASYAYVMTSTNMGKFCSSCTSVDTNIPQELKTADNTGGSHHIHGSPVYWKGGTNKYFFVWPENSYLHAYHYNPIAGQQVFNPTPTKGKILPPGGMPGGFLSVSSNGTDTNSGIVWALIPSANDANHNIVPGVLRAFKASDITQEIWNSEQNPTRDSLNTLMDNFGDDSDGMNIGYAKFSYPTIANGKVYVPTFANELVVYGLLTISANKSLLNFATIQKDSTLPSPQTVTLTAQTVNTITWTTSISYTSAPSGWLTVTAGSGQVSAKTLQPRTPTPTTLQVNTTSLPIGIYTATLTYISAANVVPVTVAYYVLDPNGLSLAAAPSQVSLKATAGQTSPNQTVNLNATLLPVSWAATVSYSSNATGWLQLDRSSGIAVATLPSPVKLSLANNNLADGYYTATVTFKDTADSTDVASVVVGLRMLPAPLTNPAYSYYIPMMNNGPESINSFIIVQNMGNRPAQVDVSYYHVNDGVNTNGEIEASDNVTCSSVPINARCQPLNKIGMEKSGSAIVYSDEPLNVIVRQSNTFGNSAYAISPGTSSNLIAPLAINHAGGFSTQLTVFNTAATDTNATVTFYDQFGHVVPAATQHLHILSHATAQLYQADSSENLPNNFYGWAEISGDAGSQLAAQVLEENDSSNFMALTMAVNAGQNKLYAPAMFNNAFGGFVSGANVVNPNNQPVQVTVTYYGADGKAYPAAPFTLDAYAVAPIYQAANKTINGLPNGGLPVGFYGTATVEATGGGVVMVTNEAGGRTQTGGLRSGDYLGAVQGSSILSLPLLANNDWTGLTTGTTIWNSTDQPASFTVQYFGDDGTAYGPSKNYTLAAHSSLPIYQGNGDLPDGFNGVALVTQTSGSPNALMATVNAQSYQLFFSYIAP